MKTHINISIDVEVAELLKKEKNKSLLINSYLRHYFELNSKSEEQTEYDSINNDFKEAGF
mgnify:CR=1 FL=1